MYNGQGMAGLFNKAKQKLEQTASGNNGSAPANAMGVASSVMGFKPPAGFGTGNGNKAGFDWSNAQLTDRALRTTADGTVIPNKTWGAGNGNKAAQRPIDIMNTITGGNINFPTGNVNKPAFDWSNSRFSDMALRTTADGTVIPNKTLGAGNGSGSGSGSSGGGSWIGQAIGAPVISRPPPPSNVAPQYQPSPSGPTYGNIVIGENETINTDDFSADDIDSSLATSMKNDWESIAPQLQQLFAQQSSMLGETDSIQQARIDGANIGYRNHAVQGRQMERAGVNLSPMQQLAMRSKNSRIAAGGANAIVNNAVTQRYDQNNAARSNLLASVNAMKHGSQANLTSIVGNQNARNQAYRDANTQRKSSTWGQLAALGGNLAMQYFSKG